MGKKYKKEKTRRKPMTIESTIARRTKGHDIYMAHNVKRSGNFYLVPSASSRAKVYKVDTANGRCTCADYTIRKIKCKHLYAVEFSLENAVAEKPVPAEIAAHKTHVPKRTTYAQPNWSAYHKSQVFEKAQFRYLLYQLCQNIETPAQETGRPRCAFADLMFAMVYKVYSCFSSRRFMTDLRDAEKFLTKVPHYNTVINAFGFESMIPALQYLIEMSSLPLAGLEADFAIDSTGISSNRFVQWNTAKHKDPKLQNLRHWVKLHICTGTLTNVVTAVEITDRFGGDSTEFIPLVRKTAQNFAIREMSADAAYSSGANYQAVVDHGGMPYIAMKSNTNPTHGHASQVYKNMYHFYSLNQEKFVSHYGKRGNVETTFSMIKAKFGSAVRSKTEVSQINEVLCKVLAHNICVLITSIHELGLKPKFWNEL
jgi:transposase